MKRGTRASFMAALLAVGCWASVSSLWATPVDAQVGSITTQSNDEMDISYVHGTDPAVGADIRNYLISGFNGGGWNSSGTVSPVAIADGMDGLVSGLSSGAVEVKYSLIGDASLDGTVTGSDFTILVGNLGKAASGWDQGNFNYGTGTNFSDFQLLAANFNNSTSLDSAELNAMNQFAGSFGDSLIANSDGEGFTIVPEPASVGMLGMMATGLLGRRRRKSR